MSQTLGHSNCATTPSSKPQRGAAPVADAIDTDILFRRCMGNRPFAASILGELEVDGIRQVQEITLLALDGDAQQLTNAAHALKGAAALLGAERLRELAAHVEAAGKSGLVDDVTLLLADLHDEMQRCLTQIPRIREQCIQPSSHSASGAADGRPSC